MANQYEKYLSRLRSIKSTRPEMRQHERNIGMLAEPFNILNRKMAHMTHAGGASTAAQVAALNEGRQQWNQFQQESFGQALGASATREAGIDAKIAEVEFANEQHKEQKKSEKSAKRSGALRTGLQALGMIAGAALAPVTGGMSLVAGASLGGAIGQVAGGFVGVNKKGNLSMNPSEWDTDAIMHGMASTATILSTHANQQETKDMMTGLTGNASAINEYIMANPDAAPVFWMQTEYIMQHGTTEDLMKHFRAYGIMQ